jgi:hypothetical protein
MIWLSLLSSVVKTGAEVFQNRQESKRLESVAEKTYMAKMATGEIDYQKAVMDNNNNGWKDELVLIMVCLPIVILAWSIFSGDPDAKQKLDMFFEYFNNFPEFYKWLVLGIFGSIYGLKPGMDLIKKNNVRRCLQNVQFTVFKESKFIIATNWRTIWQKEIN